MGLFDKVKGYVKEKAIQRAKDREFYERELSKARVIAQELKAKAKKTAVRERAKRQAVWESKSKIEKLQEMGKKLETVDKRLNPKKKGSGFKSGGLRFNKDGFLGTSKKKKKKVKKKSLFESGDDYFKRIL